MSQHILVAEDDAAIRELLRLALTGAGYRVELAADGGAALEMAFASRPRLLITDLRMPLMDELELIRALRAKDGLSRVPVILYTAFVAEDSKVKTAQRITGVLVVTKGGGLGDLRDAVAQLLDEPSAA